VFLIFSASSETDLAVRYSFQSLLLSDYIFVVLGLTGDPKRV